MTLGVEGEEKQGNNTVPLKERRLTNQSRGLMIRPAGSLG
jgi:hypothetical protein